MKGDLVASSAYNNALWCDAVCRAHGRPGEFHGALWLNRNGTPRFYPDAVTLEGPGDSEILEALADLMTSHPGREWAIKDSFSCLDLEGLGFNPLFDAYWLCLERPQDDALPGAVTTLDTEADLAVWEKAWLGREEPLTDTPFKPALLKDPEIVFASIGQGGATVGGGILNRGAGVVGLSNVFAGPTSEDAVWRQLISLAAKAFPGLPLVGYERGSGYDAACRNGFRPTGSLRIWVREAHG